MTLPSVRVEDTTQRARRAMVDNQIRTFDVTDQRVLEVFELIPREHFLPPSQADLAYSDAPLALNGTNGDRRVMLAPMVLARMIQGLKPEPSAKALVVAGGTGYPAAIMAQLSASVVALESDQMFVDATRANATALGLSNIEAVQGTLNEGYSIGAPYDLILIPGGVEQELSTLLQQLAPGGRLVTIQTGSHEATRRSGKVIRYDRAGAEVGSRVLFDATAPVLEAFRQAPAFVF